MRADHDSEFLMKIADLLDRTPRAGATVTLTDSFVRELAEGLRRIAVRMTAHG
jgi:hypothetical protein